MKEAKLIRSVLRAAGAFFDSGDEEGGRWFIGRLCVVASWGGSWDHVSVSAGWTSRGASRVPTWSELESVRRMFFLDTETVIQIHPPLGRYVNKNPYVLHLWRPQEVEIPLPPLEFV